MFHLRKPFIILFVAVSILILPSCNSETPIPDVVPTEIVPTEEPTEVATEVATPIVVKEEAEDTAAENVTLVLESWRNDDLGIWRDIIIPAFNVHYPDIEVIHASTEATEYDDALNSRLENGTAGDLITCRPFDRSLILFEEGHLVSLNDLEGMSNFSSVATSAWITDNGSDTFCVPMASVIHGFIYNKDLFEAQGVEIPETNQAFFAALESFKTAGITPLAMGTADQWDIATMGFQNIGPNYWKGEQGRVALIIGNGKLTDPEYVSTFEELANWANYMPENFETLTYPEARDLFANGEAAIYPAGSWDISYFSGQTDFEMGAFKPPVHRAGDTCYISDHTDIGIGLNANSEHPEAAKIFLNWVASPEFANLFSNAVLGFYSLGNAEIEIDDPLAAEFVSWRTECESTIRNSYQILSRGEPSLENELWRVSTEVVNGALTPEEGASQLQVGLESWYSK